MFSDKQLCLIFFRTVCRYFKVHAPSRTDNCFACSVSESSRMFKCNTFIIFQDHFVDAMKMEDFCSLPENELEVLFSDHNLNVPSESVVFQVSKSLLVSVICF